MDFGLDGRSMLVAGSRNVIEKTPVSYELVRIVTSLALGRMVSAPDNCRTHFTHVLSILIKKQTNPGSL